MIDLKQFEKKPVIRDVLRDSWRRLGDDHPLLAVNFMLGLTVDFIFCYAVAPALYSLMAFLYLVVRGWTADELFTMIRWAVPVFLAAAALEVWRRREESYVIWCLHDCLMALELEPDIYNSFLNSPWGSLLVLILLTCEMLGVAYLPRAIAADLILDWFWGVDKARLAAATRDAFPLTVLSLLSGSIINLILQTVATFFEDDEQKKKSKNHKINDGSNGSNGTNGTNGSEGSEGNG